MRFAKICIIVIALNSCFYQMTEIVVPDSERVNALEWERKKYIAGAVISGLSYFIFLISTGYSSGQSTYLINCKNKNLLASVPGPVGMWKFIKGPDVDQLINKHQKIAPVAAVACITSLIACIYCSYQVITLKKEIVA